MKFLLAALLFFSPTATAKPAPKALSVGDYVVVSNQYHYSFGCGGYVVKVLAKKTQKWYLVRLSCRESYTKLSQFDADEIMKVGK